MLVACMAPIEPPFRVMPLPSYSGRERMKRAPWRSRRLLVFVVFEAEALVGFREVVVVGLFAVVFEAVDVHAQEDCAGDAVDFGG